MENIKNEERITIEALNRKLREYIEDSGDVIDDTDGIQNMATEMFYEKVLDDDGNPIYTQADLDEGRLGMDYDNCKADAEDEIYTNDDDPSIFEQ